MGFIGDIFNPPDPQPAPNPAQIAAAQGAANTETARLQARLNRADSYTPFGSTIYEDMGDDRWKVTQTLSPEQQSLLDQRQGIGQDVLGIAQMRAGEIPMGAFTLEGVGDYQSAIDRGGLMGMPTAESLGAYAQQAEDAAFNRAMDRINPQFDRERDRLLTQLANQGITMGSDAYSDQLQQFNTRVDDARTAAAYDAVQQGSALRSALLADALTGRQQGISERMTDMQLANQGRQQAIQDRLLTRTQPLNELAALLQGAPAVQAPQVQPTAQVGVAPPDVTGAYSLSQAANQNAYNQRMGGRNAALSGLFGLGAAGIMA